MIRQKLAAFADDDDDEEPLYQHKPLDDQKLAQFSHGTVKKSRREKEKEAALAKKRDEEEEAAKAYADFIDAFEGEKKIAGKPGAGFVRSGVTGGDSYDPSRKGQSERSSRTEHPTTEDRDSPPPPLKPKPKGKRAMDTFLEELKRDQAEREARLSKHVGSQGHSSVTAMAAFESQRGSRDRGDPATSNIFVANLPPHVNEHTMGNFFARYGPVGSVKIMWPRGDAPGGPGGDITASRRAKSAGLSGFVSYMKRKDAEIAVRELDGFDWGGSILRVGWSKAVPVGPRAIYGKSRSRSRSRSRDVPHRRSSRSRDRSRDRYSRSRSRSRDHRHRSRSRSRSHDRYREKDREGGHHRTSGRRYSRSRSRSYDRYASRSRSSSRRRSHRHDRSRSRSRGARRKPESKNEIKIPIFDDEGNNSIYSTDSAEDSERERVRKGTLGKLAKQRFQSMIRGLTGKRSDLARCMAFALEHAEAAPQVAEIIIGSLLVDSTAVPRKVARLHLICDILHNSAASIPNAWKFRQEFQARLGVVFEHMSIIYHSFPGRITAETFKKQILAVVEVWEDWIVFSPDFTSELRAKLDGASPDNMKPKDIDDSQARDAPPSFTSKFKASTFIPAEEKSEAGVADLSADDDIDGMVIDDIDGEPVDDIDGQPLDDVDGEPMDDDIDGAPM